MSIAPRTIISVAEQARRLIHDHYGDLPLWRDALVQGDPLDIRLIDAPAVRTGALLCELEARFDILIEVDEVLPGLTVRELMALVTARSRALPAPGVSPSTGNVFDLAEWRARRARELEDTTPGGASSPALAAANPATVDIGLTDEILAEIFRPLADLADAPPAPMPAPMIDWPAAPDKPAPYENHADRRARHRRLFALGAALAAASGVLSALAAALLHLGAL